MHTSGVVVVPSAGRCAACREALEKIPGVEIAVEDRDTDRLVAILETESLQEQENLLRDLQAMPDIVMAELVCHYFGDEAEAATAP